MGTTEQRNKVGVYCIEVAVKQVFRELHNGAVVKTDSECGEPGAVDGARLGERIVAPSLAKHFDYCLVGLL